MELNGFPVGLFWCPTNIFKGLGKVYWKTSSSGLQNTLCSLTVQSCLRSLSPRHGTEAVRMEITWLMKEDMYRQAGTEKIMKINFTWDLEMKPARIILEQCLLGEANDLGRVYREENCGLKGGLIPGLNAGCPRLMEARGRCCGLIYHLN